MANNNLSQGETRTGTILDGNPDTPELNGTLTLDDDGLLLTFALSPGVFESYSGWFEQGHPFLMPVGDRDKSKLPSRLIFRDGRGSVQLIGCRLFGYQTDIISGHGSVKIQAEYAIFDNSLATDLSSVNGLRSEMPNLRNWLGRTSIHSIPREDGNEFGFKVKPFPSIDVASNPDLAFRSLPSFRHDLGGLHIDDTVVVETWTHDSKSLRDHLGLHESIADLLSISAWGLEDVNLRAVSRNDDPVILASGKNLGPKWSEALKPTFPAAPIPRATHPKHLILFSSIGTAGIAKWLQSHNTHSRAIRPIVHSLSMNTAAIEMRLAQVSFGLEALAYQLKKENESESAARSKSFNFEKRLRYIAEELKVTMPFDAEIEFPIIADSYNGVKHADREYPDFLKTANAWRVSVFLFRVWVAEHVGMPPQTLQPLVDRDHMASAFHLEG